MASQFRPARDRAKHQSSEAPGISHARTSHWPLTFVRRAIGWLASPKRRIELRRAGRPHGCRGSALPSAWTRRGGAEKVVGPNGTSRIPNTLLPAAFGRRALAASATDSAWVGVCESHKKVAQLVSGNELRFRFHF